MTDIQPTIENVIPVGATWCQTGRRVALATLVYVDGSAPRPRGSQMVIAEDGEYFGYLSGGCAEHAIADVGRQVFQHERPVAVRFGTGSPYVDIQLPCGSGIDVHFVRPLADVFAHVADRLARRESVALDIGVASGVVALAAGERPPAAHYRRHYRPPIQLFVAGAGPVAIELVRLAATQGIVTTLASPDEATLRAADARTSLSFWDARQLDAISVDADTAVVTAFHEHDRELAVWQRFAAEPVFYRGALGSRRAHAQRCAALANLGVPAASVARIHGPAGLATGGKSAGEIALSILAELYVEYRREAQPELSWSGGTLIDNPNAEQTATTR
ncbi:MAG: XdhC family protein [Pseudomonadota bacterium]